MPQIIAMRTKDDSSSETIAVVLSQDAICIAPDGQPWSAVSLNAQEARKLANRLLSLALEIEGQRVLIKRNSPNSITDLTSILVLYDGSEQSHRAFRLAFDFASRFLATIQLAGVFGVHSDNFEASITREDHEWQGGWLDRRVQMYSREAAMEGIELRTKLIASTDQKEVADLFNNSRFDLIIVPYRFSIDSKDCDMGRALTRLLADAAESKVLFCP